ncbi:unnamed protein product, partial [Meganyctiphanes norvegica]
FNVIAEEDADHVIGKEVIEGLVNKLDQYSKLLYEAAETDSSNKENQAEVYKSDDNSNMAYRPLQSLEDCNLDNQDSASLDGDGTAGVDVAEKRRTIVNLTNQVHEVVERVGSVARRGGGTEGGSAEADMDLGRDLKWRRTALNRVQQHKEKEALREA